MLQKAQKASTYKSGTYYALQCVKHKQDTMKDKKGDYLLRVIEVGSLDFLKLF